MHRTLSLIGIILLLFQASAQQVPCIDSSLTDSDVADQLNPRASGDLTVLVNLPFSRLFCSPTLTKFLILGDWSERHQLSLVDSADVASHPRWISIDVTSDAARAGYDFLVDESRGLRPESQYFVAVRGCNLVNCRTLSGATNFTAWKQGSAALPIGIIAGSSGGAAAFIALIIILACCLRRKPKESAKRDSNLFEPQLDTYLQADRLNGAPRTGVQARPNNYVDPERSVTDGANGAAGNQFSSYYDMPDDSAANGQPSLFSTFHTNGQQNEESGTYDEISDAITELPMSELHHNAGASNATFSQSGMRTASTTFGFTKNDADSEVGRGSGGGGGIREAGDHQIGMEAVSFGGKILVKK